MVNHIEEYDMSDCTERGCPEKECREPEYLKRPCRCGGKKFVEPKMRVTNCFPKRCCVQPCCTGCRCCCECNCTCCDQHPCRCAENMVS